MKAKLFSAILLLSSFNTLATKVSVGNSGNSFNPSTITITFGDSVDFSGISVDHDAREVSQTIWNGNGATALPGGFQTPFGGGLVLPVHLAVGTHYYVCTPHAGMGMKGVIIVQNPSGVNEAELASSISLYPNPSTGKFQLVSGNVPVKNISFEICNAVGKKIYHISEGSEIDLSHEPKGVYFITLKSGDAVVTKRVLIQ